MKTFTVFFCVLCLITSIAGMSSARETQDKTLLKYRFVDVPHQPSRAPGIPPGSMQRSAAAETTVLGWWEFDAISGEADTQGWIAYDMTAPLDTNFHVDGSAGAGPDCCPITPVNGLQSMWCGACPSSDQRYCGYVSLPGYGNGWVQALESKAFAGTTLTLAYTAVWDSEPNYDFTYVQYWDGVQQDWVHLPVNGGIGHYDGVGGPLYESFIITPPDYMTKLRFYFESDGGWSDEDGLWSTTEGAFKVDDIVVTCTDAVGGFAHFEDWEREVCGQTVANDGVWGGGAQTIPGFGIYADLYSGAGVVQEDPCQRLISHMWGFFDDPNITNYGCGGWPLQGAVPYGPDDNGHYMYNEIWSPKVPYVGTGDDVQYSFSVYRDLELDALIFFVWHVRSWVGDCPSNWQDTGFVFYGDENWLRSTNEVGALVDPAADHLQVGLGVIDMCGFWCGIFGSGVCHSHGPLFDKVRLLRIDSQGPQWVVRHIDLFQDNFPEDGSPTGYARADMAQDILPYYGSGSILPGDSIAFTVKNVVADPHSIPYPPVTRPSVFCFARVEDRFGNDLGVSPTGPNGMESPDVQQSPWLRYPWVGTGAIAPVPGGLPTGWHQFQCDYCFTTGTTPSIVPDRFCFDFMDITRASTPPGHPGDDPGNDGCFLPGQYPLGGGPGHVIRYFLGAHDSTGNWTFWHRQNEGTSSHLYTMEGQTFDHVGTLQEALDASLEFSILPDAGNLDGDEGDILFVDDADDRGSSFHAQYYFDTCFYQMGLLDRVDRFDVLGPSSAVGNSLASRVKNVQAQMIGEPRQIYQTILWNTSDLSRALVGDGGSNNNGTGAEKSMDWSLLEYFMDFHPDNPGNFFAGDDMAEDWISLGHSSAINYRSKYMHYTLVTGDHATVGLPLSPMVYRNPAMPIGPDSTYAVGGCPVLNDFDVITGVALCVVNSSYGTLDDINKGAKMIQASPNFAGTTARCVLEGFGFDFMRDDSVLPDGQQTAMDRCVQLYVILTWFQNIIEEPVAVDPVAFENSLNNFPNPFNPTTTIKYSIAARGHVSLKIYNAAGQLVRTLVDDMQAPTQNGFSKIWDGLNNRGRSVSSGVYFYKLVAANFTQTKKMVLLK